MKIGTKSVLYGAHCFFLHPWFVAWAWWRLYGFPFDPRLWVAFFVHDLGYWGMPNMDGAEGEGHPWLGAKWMSWWFDGGRVLWRNGDPTTGQVQRFGWALMHGKVCPRDDDGWIGKWGAFSLLHSRFLAKKYNRTPSRLCMADKLAIVLTPSWLYIPMAVASGEIHEYRKAARIMNPGSSAEYATTHLEWHRSVKRYVQDWVDEHKDGRPDTWTTDRTKSADETGCYGGRG